MNKFFAAIKRWLLQQLLTHDQQELLHWAERAQPGAHKTVVAILKSSASYISKGKP